MPIYKVGNIKEKRITKISCMYKLYQWQWTKKKITRVAYGIDVAKDSTMMVYMVFKKEE